MTPVWTTIGVVVLVVASTLVGLHRSPAFGHVPLGWRLVSLSSLAVCLLGLLFMLSWRPTAGPYTVDVTYPFGSALQAWQVTVGFDWVAFGVLFAASALAAARLRVRWFRAALLVSGALLWFPHLVIGLAFALAR